MEKEIHVLKLTSYDMVPSVAKEFFPHPDNGFLYLERNGKNSYDVWKKHNRGEDFVETVNNTVANNMISSVNAWNKKALEKNNRV